MRALIPALAALAAFLMACDASGGSDPSDAANNATATVTAALSCSPARTATAGRIERTIVSGGVERRYLLHVPPAYDGTEAVPLLLAFHGFTMDADFFAAYTNFGRVADAEGFIVVAPDGTGEPKRWNSNNATGGIDDLRFVDDLLTELTSSLCIDGERVYAVGYSNGGGMVQALACTTPTRFAAIAMVAATYGACREDVPMIAFHGLLDPIVPFEGMELPPDQGGGVFPNVRRSVSEWARNVGCDGLATISRPWPGVELSTYKRCFRSDGEVLLYTIIDGGHTWPGAELPIDVLGETSRAIDATATIWEFFVAHPLGGRAVPAGATN